MELGTFKPAQYGNSSGKQRMAGDYLKDFAGSNQSGNFEYKTKDFNSARDAENSSTGNNKRSYVMDVMGLGGNSKPKTSNTPAPSQPQSTPAKPAASPTPKPNDNRNPSQGGSSFTLAPPKSGEKYYANKAEVKAAWNGVYDEEEYKYYRGKDGVSTGADAYHTDMANYQAHMATMGDNPHLGLVNSMMHPDWKDHNFNGTHGQVQKNANYRAKPDDWDNMQKRREAHKKATQDFL